MSAKRDDLKAFLTDITIRFLIEMLWMAIGRIAGRNAVMITMSALLTVLPSSLVGNEIYRTLAGQVEALTGDGSAFA